MPVCSVCEQVRRSECVLSLSGPIIKQYNHVEKESVYIYARHRTTTVPIIVRKQRNGHSKTFKDPAGIVALDLRMYIITTIGN